MPYRKQRLIVGYKGYFHASEAGKLISLVEDCTTKALCLNHIVRRLPACTCSEAVDVIKAFRTNRDRVDALQTISKRICDPSNYEDLKPAFPFKEEMETARQMMTRMADHFVQPTYGSLQTSSRPQSARSVYYKPKISFLKLSSHKKTNKTSKSTPDLNSSDLELREFSGSPSPRAENGLVFNEQLPASELPIMSQDDSYSNSSFKILAVEPFHHPFGAVCDSSSLDGSTTSVDNKSPDEASHQTLLKPPVC
ncbi:uncharacterized protein [Antedon mediterranea]